MLQDYYNHQEIINHLKKNRLPTTKELEEEIKKLQNSNNKFGRAKLINEALKKFGFSSTQAYNKKLRDILDITEATSFPKLPLNKFTEKASSINNRILSIGVNIDASLFQPKTMQNRFEKLMRARALGRTYREQGSSFEFNIEEILDDIYPYEDLMNNEDYSQNMILNDFFYINYTKSLSEDVIKKMFADDDNELIRAYNKEYQIFLNRVREEVAIYIGRELLECSCNTKNDYMTHRDTIIYDESPLYNDKNKTLCTWINLVDHTGYEGLNTQNAMATITAAIKDASGKFTPVGIMSGMYATHKLSNSSYNSEENFLYDLDAQSSSAAHFAYQANQIMNTEIQKRKFKDYQGNQIQNIPHLSYITGGYGNFLIIDVVVSPEFERFAITQHIVDVLRSDSMYSPHGEFSIDDEVYKLEEENFIKNGDDFIHTLPVAVFIYSDREENKGFGNLNTECSFDKWFLTEEKIYTKIKPMPLKE